MQAKLRLPALVLWLVVAACSSDAQPQLVVHRPGGTLAIPVELARTPAERTQGLMYRTDLAKNAGMLFLFPATQRHAFWMKNTPLPLDMIFIDEELRIVGILTDTVPYSMKSLDIGKPSRYVLEVHAGFSRKHGIETGQQVEFRGFHVEPP